MTVPRPVAVLAEDEPLVRMEAADMLDALGFEVSEACHAAEAMRLLEALTGVALLYTDVRMPGIMSGIDLAHVCAERWPDTRIIVCSGCLREEAAKLPHAAHFIPKPCAERQVRTILKIFSFSD